MGTHSVRCVWGSFTARYTWEESFVWCSKTGRHLWAGQNLLSRRINNSMNVITLVWGRPTTRGSETYSRSVVDVSFSFQHSGVFWLEPSRPSFLSAACPEERTHPTIRHYVISLCNDQVLRSCYKGSARFVRCNKSRVLHKGRESGEYFREFRHLCPSWPKHPLR